MREALLLDLGALVYELHRQGKRAPELLQQKAAELTVVDEEVRELQAALDGREEPAGETTEVEAVAARRRRTRARGKGRTGEELDEDAPLDEDAARRGPRRSALDEELDEEATSAGGARGRSDDQDDETLAEHEEPRA